MTRYPEAREVQVVPPPCQLSKAEREEDMRVDPGFEEAVNALAKLVPFVMSFDRIRARSSAIGAFLCSPVSKG